MRSGRGAGHPLAQGELDRSLLRTFLESTRDFAYAKDRERRFVRVSRSMEALLGLPEQEILGKRDEDLFPPEIAARTVPDDERVLRTGEPIVDRLEGGRLSSGIETWVLTTKRPWVDHTGAIIGLVGTSRDVTQVRRLHDSERRAQQVIDQIHDSVISVDLDGFITSWNRGSEVLFGRSADAMLGRHVSELYPADEHEFLQRGIIEPLLRQGEHHVEVRLLRANGAVFHGHLSLSLIEEEGRPSGMIGYTMDITERVEAERRQHLLVRELDHRVKNTLAVVRSLARESAQRSQTLEGFQEAFAGRLHAMANAHEALASNRWSHLSLREAVQSVLAGQPNIDVTGPNIMLRPDAAPPLCLALHELATNATKHGALCGEVGRVHVAWTCKEGCLELAWTERGGSPPAPSTQRGFGLSLVRGLVEHEMGGVLSLDFVSSGLVAVISVPLMGDCEGGSSGD